MRRRAERGLTHMPPRYDSRNKDLLAVMCDTVARDILNQNGAETAIPIPRSDDGVATLLSRLAADRETVAETNIDALEAAIDEAVYDLFELNDEEREVVEEYLEVF